jgi:hypothetical protein
MGMDLDILNSPWQLAVSIVLGAISFVLVTAGLKTRNLGWALYGVALGVPSYAPSSPPFWALGALIGAGAYWISRFD